MDFKDWLFIGSELLKDPPLKILPAFLPLRDSWISLWGCLSVPALCQDARPGGLAVVSRGCCGKQAGESAHLQQWAGSFTGGWRRPGERGAMFLGGRCTSCPLGATAGAALCSWHTEPLFGCQAHAVSKSSFSSSFGTPGARGKHRNFLQRLPQAHAGLL